MLCRYVANRLGIQALTDASFHYGTDITDYEKFIETQVSCRCCLAFCEHLKVGQKNCIPSSQSSRAC